MTMLTYLERRGELKTYFDSTALDAWSQLTSSAPVSRIRATVRAGRDDMRATLLSWLPANLAGARVLDAGCGTGALAFEAARRGAQVTAIDISPSLIDIARKRMPQDIDRKTVTFLSGDMLDPKLGSFDFVVAMDSLIHYRSEDMSKIVGRLASRTGGAVLFTFAPRTLPLTLMHAAGRMFPRSERAPSIEPVSEKTLRRLIAAEPALRHWSPARGRRVASGFYKSQALEMVRS